MTILKTADPTIVPIPIEFWVPKTSAIAVKSSGALEKGEGRFRIGTGMEVG